MTIDDIMALAHTCCILYSARGEHEGEAWEELRVAIEQALAVEWENGRCAGVELSKQALLQAHKEGFDAALLPGSVPDAQRQSRLLHKPQSSKQVTGYECIHCGAAYRPTDEQCPRCKAYEARRGTK